MQGSENNEGFNIEYLETKILYTALFFGPCIFNNEDKNKQTKCTN